MPGRSDRVHRIVDHPEAHEAPGAEAWDRDARRRLDAAADAAARRFLQGEQEEACWRCEAAPAAESLGLCTPCHHHLRST